MIGNMYDFFYLYASVDGWEWDGSLDDPLESLDNPWTAGLSLRPPAVCPDGPPA